LAFVRLPSVDFSEGGLFHGGKWQHGERPELSDRATSVGTRAGFQCNGAQIV
jgi:hypothetical protein